MSDTCAIVGVGGLGAPATALLAALGHWPLRLIDPDHVELSNLPRQPLFGEGDLGKAKARAATEQVQAQHADRVVEFRQERLEGSNASDLLADTAVVIDGTDNLATKRLLNQWCCENGVALVHAGAVGWEGQLTTILPGKSACLNCLFTDLSDDSEAASCEQEGILGPVVGAIGLAAAREAQSVLQGEPPALAGRLGILNGRTLIWRSIAIARRPECPACGKLA